MHTHDRILSFRISGELLELLDLAAARRPVFTRRGVVDRGEYIRTAIRQRIANDAKNAEYAQSKKRVASKRGA